MTHADIARADQPPRRLGALVLIRDQDGRVLLVNPTYRAGWQLPGGAAHAGESIGTAAARELAEETGLTREITHALAVDQMPRNTETGSTEGLNVVCDGGRLTADEAAVVAVPDSATGELTGLRWVPLDQLGEITLPYQERRIRQAVSAAVLGNRLPLLKAGEPSA